LPAVLSSDCTTHSISESRTRLRFSSAEPLEEEAGDWDAQKRRAAVQGDADAAAAGGRRRVWGMGPEEWRARRVITRSGEEEAAALRRSRAARVAGDIGQGFCFAARSMLAGVDGRRPLARVRVLNGFRV
jgi:hypothetical protein